MRVIFWGTRGSLPTPLSARGVREKLVAALVKGARRGLDTPEKAAAFCDQELSFAESATFGGNTSCVQIDTGGPEYLLCDLGSGAREFAVRAVARHGPSQPQTYHVLVSHVHWDHILGFPFFVPAFTPGNRIRIYSCHAKLEQALRRQNAAPSFPVEFASLGPRRVRSGSNPARPTRSPARTVTGRLQRHGGDSYGYRTERAARASSIPPTRSTRWRTWRRPGVRRLLKLAIW